MDDAGPENFNNSAELFGADGAFLQRYERLVRASTRTGLESLCERVVSEHDYDLAVLARWDGTRRFANLRKLGRLARDYYARALALSAGGGVAFDRTAAQRRLQELGGTAAATQAPGPAPAPAPALPATPPAAGN